MGFRSKATVQKSKSIARVTAPPTPQIFSPTGASLAIQGGQVIAGGVTVSPMGTQLVAQGGTVVYGGISVIPTGASLVYGGGAPTWTALPAGITAWYDARRLVGYGSGDSVNTWPDLTGNGYDLTLPSGKTAPTYNPTAVGGSGTRAAVRHPDTVLTGLSATGLVLTDPYTIVLLYRALTADAGVNHKRLQYVTGTACQFATGASNNVYFGGDVSNFCPNDTSLHSVVGATGAAGVAFARYDGVDRTLAGGVGVATWNGLATGSAGASNNSGNADIFEIIVYNGKTLSVAECQSLEVYLLL